MKRVVRCGDALNGRIELHRLSREEHRRQPGQRPFFIMLKNEYGDLMAVDMTEEQVRDLAIKAQRLADLGSAYKAPVAQEDDS